MKPRVLILVLSFDKRELLLQCLASVRLQRYAPRQVLVVDNASTDGSQEAIRREFPDFELLANPENLGAISGRNLGVAQASLGRHFDYILFLDDDAQTSPDAVEKLVDALERDPSAGLACGKTYLEFGDDRLMAAGARVRFHLASAADRGAGQRDRGQYDRSEYVDACGAFALMVRAQLFERLGGFDPVFNPYGFEDFDLCLRARAMGFRTLYVADAEFAHAGTRFGRDPKPDYERWKVGNFLTLARRHMSRGERLSAFFALPLRGLLLFCRFACRGQWGVIRAQLRGAWEHFARAAR